ncbi:MAG: Gfo/Idh/MocA family oxidoreductase [Desulfobacterales bacterium]|jgi:predicted dehydrogenase
MFIHPSLSILAVCEEDNSLLRPFFSYLESISHVHLSVNPEIPEDLSPYDVVITARTNDLSERCDHLSQFVRAGGGWLGLVYLSDKPLPEIFGAHTQPVGPAAELRVLFQDSNHTMAQRLPDAIYLDGYHHCFDKISDNTEVILYADWHYNHIPVLIHRPAGDGRVAATTLQAYDHPVLQKILYRLLCHLAGQDEHNQMLGVGLLGYAPSVGKLHGLGVGATLGLELRAACDLNPERLDQALQDFPELKLYASAEDLANDPSVDLVIIATAPNSHAHLSVQMMDAGKHVVCEKPLALSLKETAAMLEMANKRRVHLSCHQNRRWDVDYLAIKQALSDGLLGDLFYLETFVGGFNHPCGYWHSHAEICGGLAYDWGGHYLDWIVSLVPGPVKTVISTSQKRVWHDVTNADQERIQIRFADGQEAEFIHSDIAAVRKPKWYLLGTRGAIIGQWRDVVEYEIDPDLYFEKHAIPATEMPADLTLHRRDPSGQIVTQNLAIPQRQHYLFHQNIADHLLTGEPLAAPLEHSVRVVGILEAAAKSAANGGTLEVVDDERG